MSFHLLAVLAKLFIEYSIQKIVWCMVAKSVIENKILKKNLNASKAKNQKRTRFWKICSTEGHINNIKLTLILIWNVEDVMAITYLSN